MGPGLIRLTLDGRELELRQQPWVVRERSWRDLRDQWRHTTDLHVPSVAESERDETFRLAEMLTTLLGFITASEVGVAGWTHRIGGRIAYTRTTTGRINYFIPIIDTRDGKAVLRFVEMVWDGYKRERERRNLAAVFHYLALAEREETPVELKLAILFIVLEQLKHSFAVSRGYIFVPPWFHVPGTVKPTPKSRRGFEKLLLEMFDKEGMSPSLGAITDVRNEILHSGLSARPVEDLFALGDDLLATIREYLLRLIGYVGPYFSGQSGGVHGRIR